MENGVKIRGFVLIGVFIASLVWTASASAQSDFYKGKTITVYIGTTPGALYDQWSRLLAQYMPKHIPGKPDMISQNMPGAGHKIAANYVYNKTKPDGLSVIGSIVPSLYFDQLIGRPEVQYDWAKFVWIGSPVQGESQMYMRADTPYKTIDDVRNAKEPPRCGAQGTSDSAYYLPKLFDETLGSKIQSRSPAIQAGRRSILPSSEERFIAALLPLRRSCRGSPITPGARMALCAILFRPGASEMQS